MIFIIRGARRKIIDKLFAARRARKLGPKTPTISNTPTDAYLEWLPSNLQGRSVILEWKNEDNSTSTALFNPGDVIPATVMRKLTGDLNAKPFQLGMPGEVTPECVSIKAINVAGFSLGESLAPQGAVDQDW